MPSTVVSAPETARRIGAPTFRSAAATRAAASSPGWRNVEASVEGDARRVVDGEMPSRRAARRIGACVAITNDR